MSDNLVPEPQASVFDSVSKVLGDEEAARRVMANPQLAAGVPNGHPPASVLAHSSSMRSVSGHAGVVSVIVMIARPSSSISMP